MGLGSRVQFWEDKWILPEPLSTRFPSLYKASRTRHFLINEVISHGDSGLNWNLQLRRRLSESEIADFAILFEVIEVYNFIVDEDQRIWGDNKMPFSVGVVMSVLIGRRLSRGQSGIDNFLYQKVWKIDSISPKV